MTRAMLLQNVVLAAERAARAAPRRVTRPRSTFAGPSSPGCSVSCRCSPSSLSSPSGFWSTTSATGAAASW